MLRVARILAQAATRGIEKSLLNYESISKNAGVPIPFGGV
jgi:hypothetical protein